jgi:TolB protein
VAFGARPGGNVDVYVIGSQGGSLRRLTTDPADDAFGRFSRDGGWIYFTSNRTGRHEIWKRRADGSGADGQVTRNGGWASAESADGRTLFYAKSNIPGIWEMPAGGGEERLVIDMPLPPTSNWEVRGNGVYYLSLSDRQSIALISRPGAASGLSAFPLFSQPRTAGSH